MYVKSTTSKAIGYVRSASSQGISRASSSLSWLLKSIASTARDDPKQTIHAFKMAFALTLVFLLVLLEAPYALFGSHTIWAVMTVVVVFEFSSGKIFAAIPHRKSALSGASLRSEHPKLVFLFQNLL
jgi:uncharacterized membrane protein YccC